MNSKKMIRNRKNKLAKGILKLLFTVVLAITFFQNNINCQNSLVINYNEVEELISQRISQNKFYFEFINTQDSILESNRIFIRDRFIEIQRYFNGGCLSPKQAENYENYINYLANRYKELETNQSVSRESIKSTFYNSIAKEIKNDLYKIRIKNNVDIIFDKNLLLYKDEKLVQDITPIIVNQNTLDGKEFKYEIEKIESQIQFLTILTSNQRNIKLSFKEFMEL